MLLRSKEDGELYDVNSTESYTDDIVFEYARHDGSSKYSRRTGYESLEQFNKYWESPKKATKKEKKDHFFVKAFGFMVFCCAVLAFLLAFILSDKYNEPIQDKLDPKAYSYCFEKDNYVKGLVENNPGMDDSRLAELKSEYYLRCINEKGKQNE